MRKLFSAFISILICILFVLEVSAHPGGTDSDGGHWDYDAGEYHYHHGYTAHSHYDMDGDGAVDCPYDFVDRTDSHSGTSNGGSSYSSRSYNDSSNTRIVTVYEDREVIKEVPVIPIWIKWAAGLSIVWILYLIKSNRWKKDDIDNLERTVKQLKLEAQEREQFHKDEIQRMYEVYKDKCFQFGKTHREEIDQIVSDKDKIINALQLENTSLGKKLHSVITSISVGEVYFPEPSNPEFALHRIEIPEDVYFIDGNIPVKGIVTSSSPFGDFTVFTLSRSDIYHSNKYCSGTFSMEAVHLFDVIGQKRPCRRCGKDHGSTPPKWYIELADLRKQISK